MFVGHATVRRLVMKDDYKRAARPDEIARMALLVDQGMREGAVGLSSGLEYEVGGYAETDELIELAKVAARYGGIYMTHIRDEADKSFDALQGSDRDRRARAHVAVQISHIKLGTVGVWHKSAEAIALIEGARSARRRRHRRRVPVQRVELDDHRAGAGQALRLSAERREGARRCRRRRQRAHRPARGASRVRVPHARRDRARSAHVTPVELFIQIVKDGGAGVVCTSMVDDGHSRVLSAAVGDGRQRRRHRRCAIRAAPARFRACSAATCASRTG